MPNFHAAILQMDVELSKDLYDLLAKLKKNQSEQSHSLLILENKMIYFPLGSEGKVLQQC